MTLEQLRTLFLVLEQQRVSKDYLENLGKPDFERFQAREALRSAHKEK